MDLKLATILAADVVGYSNMMEADEQGTFERLRAGRKELFEPEIAEAQPDFLDGDLSIRTELSAGRE